jgi:malate synthase
LDDIIKEYAPKTEEPEKPDEDDEEDFDDGDDFMDLLKNVGKFIDDEVENEMYKRRKAENSNTQKLICSIIPKMNSHLLEVPHKMDEAFSHYFDYFINATKNLTSIDFDQSKELECAGIQLFRNDMNTTFANG